MMSNGQSALIANKVSHSPATANFDGYTNFKVRTDRVSKNNDITDPYHPCQMKNTAAQESSNKVDDIMTMPPCTSKGSLEESAPLVRLRKLESSKVQTRSTSSAKRKPASPRKRPTTLHEAVQSGGNTEEVNPQGFTGFDEPPKKVKLVMNSATTFSGSSHKAELSSAATSGSFPFACDLATLTGIQTLGNMSSLNKNETLAISERKPNVKARKKPQTLPLPSPDFSSFCPDLVKASALISSNAAALAATMNGLLLAGAVNAPDATAQALSNPDVLATFTALGLVPFLGDSATARGNREFVREKPSIDPALLETAAVAAASGSLGLFGADLSAISEFIGKTAMPSSSAADSAGRSEGAALSARQAAAKGHARRVKQKATALSSESETADHSKKPTREGTATKKLFCSLQNEMPFVSRNAFSKENEDGKSEIRNGAREERVDLEELENFAQTFKKQRIKFGFTQGDVGMALGRRYGTDFSQTTISRFEALNLSFKNMCKLRPLLKEWLADAEAAIASGASVSDLLEAPSKNSSVQCNVSVSAASNGSISAGSPSPSGSMVNSSVVPLRKRRKRTNLDATQRAALDQFFKVNPRPDHDKMAQIAEMLELDRDVIRVWFCNRRQKLRKE